MSGKKALTQERLKELLAYDPETGEFIWKVSVGRARAGAKVCSSLSRDGYARVCIGRTMYAQHRLAWFYVMGRWPVAELDHIDLDRLNNRFKNLREATRKQNAENHPGYRGDAIKVGVYWLKRLGKWGASITHNRKSIHLGVFKDYEAAVAERIAAERRLFTHARSA